MNTNIEQTASGDSRDYHTRNMLLAAGGIGEPDLHFSKDGLLDLAHLAKVGAYRVYAGEKQTELAERRGLTDNRCCVTDAHVKVVSDRGVPRFGVKGMRAQ